MAWFFLREPIWSVKQADGTLRSRLGTAQWNIKMGSLVESLKRFFMLSDVNKNRAAEAV